MRETEEGAVGVDKAGGVPAQGECADTPGACGGRSGKAEEEQSQWRDALERPGAEGPGWAKWAAGAALGGRAVLSGCSRVEPLQPMGPTVQRRRLRHPASSRGPGIAQVPGNSQAAGTKPIQRDRDAGQAGSPRAAQL